MLVEVAAGTELAVRSERGGVGVLRGVHDVVCGRWVYRESEEDAVPVFGLVHDNDHLGQRLQEILLLKCSITTLIGFVWGFCAYPRQPPGDSFDITVLGGDLILQVGCGLFTKESG